MIKIEGDHILALISGFLKRYGEEKLALKVQQKIVNPQALQAVPLTKKKLEKIIKNYILQDEYINHYSANSPPSTNRGKTQNKKKTNRKNTKKQKITKDLENSHTQKK